jgi:hypothetical protein
MVNKPTADAGSRPQEPGGRVIWNRIAFESPVIPAKAGIQSVGGAFPMARRVDSRFRGNDRASERPVLANDTATQDPHPLGFPVGKSIETRPATAGVARTCSVGPRLVLYGQGKTADLQNRSALPFLSLSFCRPWAETRQGEPMPLAVILSEATDPGSSRGVGEQSKLRGFFAQNAGSE